MNEGLIFYRCNLCHKVVSVWDLQKSKGCHKCGHSKISPANLTFFEKIVQIAKHPNIGTWKNFKFEFETDD